MSGQFCKYCEKELSEEKGEMAHGCLECHMDIKADKLYFQAKRIAELEEKCKELENHLKCLDENTKRLEKDRDTFNGLYKKAKVSACYCEEKTQINYMNLKTIRELERQNALYVDALAKIYHTGCFGCNLGEVMVTIEDVIEIEETKKDDQ